MNQKSQRQRRTNPVPAYNIVAADSTSGPYQLQLQSPFDQIYQIKSYQMFKKTQRLTGQEQKDLFY